MEKDQLDSLATVAVGSEKMPVPHSHYAPSEVYSASESPPAYTRPPMKSTAVQIARIIATTMIAVSFIIGSFILASGWLQARASCTPESIAAMQAQLRYHQSQNEFIKNLQPQALIQNREVVGDHLQSLSDASSAEKDEVQADTKDIKVQNDRDSKTDNDVDSQTDSDDDDEDYDDGAFPPVHIKLPLQLDLDDLAGTLLQQARSLVSCVVERRRSDDMLDGANDNGLSENNTDRQRMPRLRGERVTILCESGDQRPEQQEQDMLTPIIVPLGTVQVPIQPQDNGYNRYQIHSQYQVPETQRVPMPVDARGMNAPFPIGLLPPEIRNLPGIAAEMGPILRMAHQQNMIRPQPIEIGQIPIELRRILMDPLRAMKVSPDQEQQQQQQQQQHQQHQQQHQQQQQQQQQQQHPSIVFVHPERPSAMDQQTQGMVPPLPLHQVNQENADQPIHGRQNPAPSMMIPRRDSEQPRQPSETQQVPDKPSFPFHGIPTEFRKMMEQVPMEITDMIQQFAGVRPAQAPVPEGARREQVQEFKPFPEARLIPFDAFPLPIGVRNLPEHGNVEGRARQPPQDSEGQQEQVKPFAGSENQAEENTGRSYDIPADVMNLLNQFVDGPAFPIPRFAMPVRPMESMEVPVEARAQVSGNQTPDEQTQHHDEDPSMPQQQQQQQHQDQPQQRNMQARMMVDHEEIPDENNRHHTIQPRSVRSVPEPFAHPREKRVRRCACNCAC